MSVFGMTQGGYRVVFDDAGSYAQHKTTKRIIPLESKRRGWVLQCKVEKLGSSRNGSGVTSAASSERSVEAVTEVPPPPRAVAGRCRCDQSGCATAGPDAVRHDPARFVVGEVEVVCSDSLGTPGDSGRWCPFGRLPAGVRPKPA